MVGTSAPAMAGVSRRGSHSVCGPAGMNRPVERCSLMRLPYGATVRNGAAYGQRGMVPPAGGTAWCRLWAARFPPGNCQAARGGVPAAGLLPGGHGAANRRHCTAALLGGSKWGAAPRRSGAARHGAAGTVPGGHGASIEARFHRARHLGGTVPGGTKYGAAQRGGAKPPGKGQAQNRRRPCCPPGLHGGAARCGACCGRHGVVPG